MPVVPPPTPKTKNMDPLSAGLGAGASLLDGFLGRNAQKKANEQNHGMWMAERGWAQEDWIKNRQYDKASWDTQNKYNLDMWNMQNEYNSPKSQMERFKEAGLNPNLIYGKGTSGPAGSVAQGKPATAGDVRGTSAPTMKSTMQGYNAFKDIYNIQQTQAQTGAINAQKEVNIAQAALLDRTNAQETEAWPTNLEAKKEQLRALTSDANVKENTEQGRTELVEKQVTHLGQSIKNLEAQEAKTKIEKGILDIQEKLNKQGIFKTDHVILRQIAKDGNLDQFTNYIKSLLDKMSSNPLFQNW